jgi:predicted RND superfamily exporter protein
LVAPLAKLLIDHHRLCLLLAGILMAIGAPLSSRLELDWRIEGLFPPGDSSVAAYRRLQERFGGNQIVLAVYRDPELWNSSGAGLERLEQISHSLADIDGVASVLSLAELHSILEKLRGPIQLLNIAGQRPPPLLDPDDSLAQAMLEVFEGYTHQQESQFTTIACILSTAQTEEVIAGDQSQTSPQRLPATTGPLKRDATLQGLRQVMAELPQPATDGFITGEPVLVSEGFRMVQRDGWRLGLVSSCLVSLVLLACFRSLRWTLIPLAVVHWSLIMTRATLVALGLDLTLISSTLTAVVTVIGVATSIHLLLKFQQYRRSGAGRPQALQASFAELIAPIAWACITDAAGFLSLMAASVGPIRDFGLMMAVGSMMVLVAIVMLVPGLALIGSWDTDPRTPQADLLVRLWLRRWLQFGLAHRRAGLGLLLALSLFGIVGSTLMRVETDYTKNFAASSPLVQGYEVIERELGGAGVWDVMLPAPQPITTDYLQQVLILESQLRQLRVSDGERQLGLTKVLSIADAELASRASPLLAALPVSARLQGMRAAMPDFSRILLTPMPVPADPKISVDRPATDATGHLWLRVMLRSHERVSAEAKQALVDAVSTQVQQFTASAAWRQQFSATAPQAEVAGYSIMLGNLVSSILSDQWKCFLLASLGILVVMVLATGSLRLALLAIIPNALPITLVLGTMGWLGMPINMGAAMIAAVSLGLSVDSSIHYLIHYRRVQRAPPRRHKALQSAQENVGLAVVLSTLALVAGFISLTVSEFVPTVVFGTLASLTMLGGLIGNLVLLPLLLDSWKSPPA